MQRRAGQLWDGGLQSVEAIIHRQQIVLTESHNDGLLLHSQNCRTRVLRPGGQIGYRAALLPPGNGLGIDSIPAGQCPQALLTMLYRSTDRLCRGGAPV